MERSYATAYRDLYERHWWWRAREAFVLREISRLAPPQGFGRILDVGCGDGLIFDAVDRYGDVEGVEADATLVTELGRSRGPIHVGPFDRGFAPDRSFGLVLMLDVIEHLDDDRGALAHARSLLGPGGHVLVTVPALPVLWTAHDDLNHHRRRYHLETLREAIEGAGLRWLRGRYYFTWMVLPKLAVRAKEACFRGTSEVAQVPGPWTNKLCLAISNLDHSVFRRFPLPLGSSLFAVASRD